MLVIGIDAGVTGAIAFYRPGKLSVHDMPTKVFGSGKGKTKRCVNGKALTQLIRNETADSTRVVSYREYISSMPGQGVASMLSLGYSVGCVDGVLGALDLVPEEIAPISWKKAHGVLIPTIPKEVKLCMSKTELKRLNNERTRKAKTLARKTASELFPKHKDLFKRVNDHNRADATLIAVYGYNLEVN